MQRLSTGASITVSGALVPSQGKGQKKWELAADNVEIVGPASSSLPAAKEGTYARVSSRNCPSRPRSNLFSSVFRVRSRLAFAVHHFFQDRGFVYVHTPIITGSDCEGAGELFRVTTLNTTRTCLEQQRAKSITRKTFLPGRLDGERPLGSGGIRAGIVQRLHLWTHFVLRTPTRPGMQASFG